MNIEYRILTVEDVNDYQSIRLELLKNNPKSFGSSFEEESTFLIDRWESRLQIKMQLHLGHILEKKSLDFVF